MAYVNNTRVVGTGFADRLAGLIKWAQKTAQQRAIYDQTVRELNALTNRELADLGIARLNIQDVARAAAYGK